MNISAEVENSTGEGNSRMAQQKISGHRKKIRKKKKIVFLPYKASMWDSMESIWQAAKADKENCRTYVMPLPYREASTGKWYCELELFPDYVPVIDCRKTNLAALQADIIYIHNPYDGENTLTSVAAEYYSGELRKYTKQLIYVPYFVAGNYLEPGFASVPGVLNAHHVVVESDQVKGWYEQHYRKYCQQHQIAPDENKFLALGSPKFDKVRSSNPEDFSIPKEWQQTLRGRKAVLFNTTLAATKLHRNVFLAQLRYVFQVFQCQEEFVLWWRPHPFLMTMLRIEQPETFKMYQDLVGQYRQAGWGIYDDSAELNRAISCTAAYYGDYSSVVYLYQETGKPVVIQSFSSAAKNCMYMTIDRFLLGFSMLRHQRSQAELPAAWHFVQGKQIIFYQLSLKNLQGNPAELFQELQFIFSCVHELPETVLWCYLDPVECQLAGSSAEGKKFLEKLKAVCESDSQVLYDNTGNQARALSWMDLYYGELLPAAWVCRYLRKPVLEQDGSDLQDPARMAEKIRSLFGQGYVLAEGGKRAVCPYVFLEPEEKNLEEASPVPLAQLRQARREDYSLPEDWRERCAGKRVVLFRIDNAMFETGVWGLQVHLHHVFRVFAASTKLLLWWYSDPSLKDQAGVIDDRLRQVYEQLEQEYQRAGWGIFDDSGNLPRAIACTDAFYGDWSPVMWLYHASGRPTLLQYCDDQIDVYRNLDAASFVEALSALQKRKAAAALPAGWKEKLDGKKVVLLSFQCRSFLACTECLAVKLQSVFAVAKAQPGIVLWWRPDVVLQTILDDMGSTAAEPYRQLCEMYRAEGWGIYDDTADFARAVAWADAVYADNEQLLGMFSRMGKPALRLNVRQVSTQ